MGLPRPRRIDPVRQSPRSLMFGFFAHGTVHLNHLNSLVFCLAPTVIVRPPSPSHSARRSSQSLRLLRLGAAHPGHAAFAALHRYHLGGPTTGPASLPFSLPLIGSLTAVPPADRPVLLRSRAVLPYRAVRNHLGTVGE